MCASALLIMVASGFLGLADSQGASALVIDATSGQPISGATVQFSDSGKHVQEAETDALGKAKFPELQAGAYWLCVEKSGYVDVLDAQREGRLVTVSSDPPIVIALTATAAISGQVVDSQGKPVQGGNVIAMVRRGNVRREFVPFGEAARTDDEGRYRLYALAPGRYSVAVVPTGEESAAEIHGPTLYGSSGSGGAAVFDLRPGEDKTLGNLMVASSPSFSISGKVTSGRRGSGVSAVNGAAVSLVSQGELRVRTGAAVTDSDGLFVIADVPQGDYQITAWVPFEDWDAEEAPKGAEARVASRSVSVSGRDLTVDLELHEFGKTRGQVIWQGDHASARAEKFVFRPADGGFDLWSVAVAVNGDAFTAVLPAGRYKVELPGATNPYRIAAVRVGGQVAPNGVALLNGSAILTIILTTATGGVAGTATHSDGSPAKGWVLLASADGDVGAQIAPLDAAGHYEFGKVLVGSYRLAALDRVDSIDYIDPAESSKLGMKLVTVEAGRKLQLDLVQITR